MTRQRPFRFGAHDLNADSRAEFVAKARKAEDLGYATLLVSDHFVGPYAPVAALAVAAETTQTLRVGSLVFDNDFRHPAVLAKEAATLDLLSDGRFELGIGAGWHVPDYELSGIPFDAPAVRVSRLEESLHIIKGLFSETPLTYAGAHYTITNLNGLPKPVQRPHPPIYVGAGGKRLLSIAAREADIIGFSVHRLPDGSPDLASITPEGTAQRVAWVREAAGDRFNDLELSMLCVAVEVTDDRWKVAEQLAGQFGLTALGMSVEQVLAVPQLLIGTVDQIVEGLQARRERYGISYVIVFEKSMEAFAPVVARLAGT
jgi:probable F420-dependent oxidoreductase